MKACTERGLGFNQSRFHHVVRVLQRLDLQRLRSITAFPACYGPVHLSISGKLANPGTFLRVPPGSARDRTLRHVAHVICFTSLIGSSNVLARKDQREVCPLSREGMFHPLSIPLQVGFCFFPHPLPTMPWVFLAKGFPGVQGHGRVGSERPSRGHSSPSPRTVRTALTVHGSPFTCTLE